MNSSISIQSDITLNKYQYLRLIMNDKNYINNHQEQQENNDNFSDDGIEIQKSTSEKVLSKLDKFLFGQRYFIFLVLLICLIIIPIILHISHSQTIDLEKEKQLRKEEAIHYKKRIYDSARWHQTIGKNSHKQYSRPSYETGLLSPSGKVVQKGGKILRVNGTVRDIQWFKINEKGQNIDQVLYDAETIQKKYEFFQQRLNYVTTLQAQYPFMRETLYNMKVDLSLSLQQSKSDLKQYQKLQKMYQLQKYDTQLPLCIVDPGYNNNANFRIENNLNSIFIQNYTNYFLVLIDDASDDGSYETYMKYFKFYDINPNRYAYVRNTQRLTAVENIYRATYDYCSKDSIVITVDADDQLIGKNTFKIFNAGYQIYQAGSLYSNFVYYVPGKYFKYGQTSQYSQYERMNNLYRQDRKYSMLRSYRNDLFRKIKLQDLQYDNGTFYKSVYDNAIFFPIFQLSCSRVYKLEQSYYLYNYDTGMNDFRQRYANMVQVRDRIMIRQKYTCDPDFNKTISLESGNKL